VKRVRDPGHAEGSREVAIPAEVGFRAGNAEGECGLFERRRAGRVRGETERDRQRRRIVAKATEKVNVGKRVPVC
jgi:hypothetical protein